MPFSSEMAVVSCTRAWKGKNEGDAVSIMTITKIVTLNVKSIRKAFMHFGILGIRLEFGICERC